ncbi:hypothetical protein QIW52_09625 [Clostridioides difficile]|nr:hypothetical protein [Clostridioides difficile]
MFKTIKVIIESKNDVKGIDEDDLILLFNRFYMLDKSKFSNSFGLRVIISKFLVNISKNKKHLKN